MHNESKPKLALLRQLQTYVLVAMFAIVGLAVSGCDKVPDIPTAGELLGNGEEEAVTETTTTPSTTTETIAPPEPVVPAGPTPQEIVDQFTSLRPDQITDGSLAQLASSPEAAAAITEVNLSGALVSATGLGFLSKLPNLESLDASNSRVADQSLMVIGQSQSLRSVKLANSDANDQVVGALAKIPHLQTLDLSNTKISAGAASDLGSMRELTDLSLMGTATDQMVAGLTALPIRRLNLSRSKITNASLPMLLQIQTLESLNLEWCSVTGVGFDGFGKSGIKKLSVGATQFGTEGLLAIKGMRSLEDLNIFDAGVQMHLKANVFRTFPNLRILNAGKNALSDAALDVFFKGHKSLEELHLAHHKGITDNGLQYLIGVRNLKRLNLIDTSVNGPGAQALKKRLPECTIETPRGVF